MGRKKPLRKHASGWVERCQNDEEKEHENVARPGGPRIQQGIIAGPPGKGCCQGNRITKRAHACLNTGNVAPSLWEPETRKSVREVGVQDKRWCREYNNMGCSRCC